MLALCGLLRNLLRIANRVRLSPFNIVDATLYQAYRTCCARMTPPRPARHRFRKREPRVLPRSLRPNRQDRQYHDGGRTFRLADPDRHVRASPDLRASIAKIRGCVRGVSSEFVLACDMRFASRGEYIAGPTGSRSRGASSGGGTERLPLWSAVDARSNRSWRNDFDGDTAAHTGTSTARFQMQSWTALSMHLRDGSPRSMGAR